MATTSVTAQQMQRDAIFRPCKNPIIERIQKWDCDFFVDEFPQPDLLFAEHFPVEHVYFMYFCGYMEFVNEVAVLISNRLAEIERTTGVVTNPLCKASGLQGQLNWCLCLAAKKMRLLLSPEKMFGDLPDRLPIPYLEDEIFVLGHPAHPLYPLGVRTYDDIFIKALSVRNCLAKRHEADQLSELGNWAKYSWEDLRPAYRVFLRHHRREEEERLVYWSTVHRDMPFGICLRNRLMIFCEECPLPADLFPTFPEINDIVGRPEDDSILALEQWAVNVIKHCASTNPSQRLLSPLMRSCGYMDAADPIPGQSAPEVFEDELEAALGYAATIEPDAVVEEEGSTQPPSDEEEGEEEQQAEGETDAEVITQPPDDEQIEVTESAEVAAAQVAIPAEILGYADDPVQVMAEQWMYYCIHPLTYVRSFDGKAVNFIEITKTELRWCARFKVRVCGLNIPHLNLTVPIGSPPQTIEQYKERTTLLLSLADCIKWCKVRNIFYMMEPADPPLKRARFDTYIACFGSERVNLRIGKCSVCWEDTSMIPDCPVHHAGQEKHWLCAPCYEAMYLAKGLGSRTDVRCPVCRGNVTELNIARTKFGRNPDVSV
jgi:hypothetical protein